MALLRKARRFNRQVPRLLRSALVDLNSSGIESTAGAVTAWRNSGSGGSAYDLDTILGTAANLRKHSSGAMLLDGVSGSFASAPDSPAASVTGDITLIAYAALDDWTPPTDDRTLIGKWSTATGGLSYLLRIQITTGKIQLITTVDGISSISSLSTISPAFIDGTGHWVRASLDVSGGVSNFYTSDDPATTAIGSVNWTLFGAADVTHVSPSIANTTSLLTIGAQKDAGTDDLLSGQIHRACVIASTDPTATPSVDFNPSLAGRSATGLDSDTWFGAEMLKVSARTINLTDWTASGTGYVIDNGDGTVTVDDQDLDLNQYQVFVSAVTSDSQSHRQVLNLAQGTAALTQVQMQLTGGTAIFAFCNIDWSDPLSAEFGGGMSGTVESFGNGVYRFTMQATNNATGNTNLNFSLRAASSTAGTTGSVIVHGEVSLQSEWELHGGAVIQNSGQDEVKSYGAAGLETTVAPAALIPYPMTMFLVGKADDASTGSSQQFTASKSDFSSSPQIVSSATGDFLFNAGTALTAGAGDSAAHLHTVRHSGDSTSYYEVDAIGEATGDAGPENYEYGTLFASASGASTLTGSIARHIIKPGKTNNLKLKQAQQQLKRIHSI